ncbi:hypothetical protein NVIE_018140 [Nitrososphaera viennensis EN76]|uniref:Uncharacterized protein n=1 Tax=Nitrososphaera viennensis EN76 TaxID=926571 RepID=A0A060HKR4_9ARCH|nr:hypothetical protein NVIE_018140 [Nitrososphaera viennensis EN76]
MQDMNEVLFTFVLPSYSLATIVVIYTLIGLFISAMSALALYRMIIGKSKSLTTQDDEFGHPFKRE